MLIYYFVISFWCKNYYEKEKRDGNEKIIFKISSDFIVSSNSSIYKLVGRGDSGKRWNEIKIVIWVYWFKKIWKENWWEMGWKNL